MSEPDGALRAAEWQSLARAAARGGELDQEVEVLRELLTFRLAQAPYAIPVERVREIVRPRQVTPMPRVPGAVIGVIALRGEIVQVLDLRRRLDLPAPVPGRSSRVIVLHGEDERVTGVLVDEVREVLRVREEAIRQTSASDGGYVSELCSRGDEFISMIDVDRVLDLGGDH